MRRTSLCIGAGLIAVLAGACAQPRHEITETAAELTAPAPEATPAVAPAPEVLYHETGTAVWYGRELQGMATASGEIFDMNSMSAAHRALPFGTVIRVTDLDNGRTIEVTVNDRGPFLRDRVLALSYGAARQLGFVGQGTAQVRIETLAPVPEGGTWTVLAASYAEEENARSLKYRLSQRYEVITIVPAENIFGKVYRVLVGNYSTQKKAERISAKLVLDGLEPVVLRKD